MTRRGDIRREPPARIVFQDDQTTVISIRVKTNLLRRNRHLLWALAAIAASKTRRPRIQKPHPK